MRLDWLEDILAVIETGSFAAAAKRRFVTQPAFSRRIRAIEDQIGAELFDRNRKPVTLQPAALAHQDEFRRLLTDMKGLLSDLRRQGREAHGRVVIASQHAITATLAPDLIGSLLSTLATTVRLRSANRDECLAMLMTKQADVLIAYQTEAETAAAPGEFLERAELGHERLIPVAACAGRHALAEGLARGELPVVGYPNDAFLGRMFNDDILPRLGEDLFVLRRVETALTIAALECAVKGIGVAWVPADLARRDILGGRLADLSDILPGARLAIVALRLRGERPGDGEEVWAQLRQYRRDPQTALG